MSRFLRVFLPTLVFFFLLLEKTHNSAEVCTLGFLAASPLLKIIWNRYSKLNEFYSLYKECFLAFSLYSYCSFSFSTSKSR